jgi:hypothetical protein
MALLHNSDNNMTKTILSMTTQDNASSEHQHYLHSLWGKIEKYELRNEKAGLKVNALYQEFEETILPYEKKKANTCCAWVRHLMSFLSIKDMKKKYKRALLEYLEYEMNTLNRVAAFCDDVELKNIYAEFEAVHSDFFKKENKQALDEACREFEDILKISFGGDIDPSNYKIREALASGNPEDIYNLMHSIESDYYQTHPEYEDEEEQQEQEWKDFEFNYYKNEEDTLNIKEIFKGTQLSKMYKRLANVLHPDKELDPTKKKEKVVLMQKLVKAKKEKDIITLIRMFSEYIPDDEHLLDENIINHIEHLLEMQLRTLNLAHKDIFNKQGMKSEVWKLFSASSKKKTKEKIHQYIQHIETTNESIHNEIKKLNSEKKIIKFIRSLPSHEPQWL